eukprot:Hpha_TRINITY_DN16740_c2_g2::TRINITY_DN16740_c2_g2_i1::g.79891::m.79891
MTHPAASGPSVLSAGASEFRPLANTTCQSCGTIFRADGRSGESVEGNERVYATWDAAMAAMQQHTKMCSKQQRKASTEAAVNPLALATGERYVGTVRGTATPKRRIYFIDCPAVRAICQRDVQISDADSQRFTAGTVVSFTTTITNAGMPLALDVEASDGTAPGKRTPGLPPSSFNGSFSMVSAPGTDDKMAKSANTAPEYGGYATYKPLHPPPEPPCGPVVKCPNDQMCMLINDPAHQADFRHTCKIESCPHAGEMWHYTYFDHPLPWGGAPMPPVQQMQPVWPDAMTPPQPPLPTAGLYLPQSQIGLHQSLPTEGEGMLPLHAMGRSMEAPTRAKPGTPNSPLTTLPLCHLDKSCKQINEPQHQMLFRHTCKLRPCMHVDEEWHNLYFLHTPDSLPPDASETARAVVDRDGKAPRANTPVDREVKAPRTDSPLSQSQRKGSRSLSNPRHGGCGTITVDDLHPTGADTPTHDDAVRSSSSAPLPPAPPPARQPSPRAGLGLASSWGGLEHEEDNADQ